LTSVAAGRFQVMVLPTAPPLGVPDGRITATPAPALTAAGWVTVAGNMELAMDHMASAAQAIVRRATRQ
jgi:hypothetical protein